MLENVRVRPFTVSELLRENHHVGGRGGGVEGGYSSPPPPGGGGGGGGLWEGTPPPPPPHSQIRVKHLITYTTSCWNNVTLEKYMKTKLRRKEIYKYLYDFYF